MAADYLNNSGDYIFYFVIAFVLTLVALYTAFFFAIMRDLRHAPIVIGLKALSVVLYLSVIIRERFFISDVWDALWNLVGDLGFLRAVPIASVLAVINLAAGVFLYFMFFVQSERDADYRRKQRQQALAAQRASQAAPRSKSSRKNRRSEYSDSDSESDSDIEFARKKSSRGSSAGRKSKSSKKTGKKPAPAVQESELQHQQNLNGSYNGGFYPNVGMPMGSSYTTTTYTTTTPSVQTVYGMGAQPLLQADDSNVKRHVIELPPPTANGEATVYRIDLDM